MEKNSTRAEFQLGLKFSSRFMSPRMRFLALSNGMKYPMQSQINSDNRLNGFVLRFNCLIFNILYATTLTQVISNFCQSVPIRVLSIRSDPGFVNPFRSGFCQSVPIRSDPGFVDAAILLISSNKTASSLLYMKRFSKYMSFKIEILLIPLHQAISHIF